MKNLEINEVYTLFEEIKELIKKGNNKTPVVQPEIELPDLSVINELTDKMNEAIEEIRKPIRTEHLHTFNIASNKIFIGVIGLCLVCFFCLFTIYRQRDQINTFKDNSLKYRYIKMKGDINPNELIRLENLFDNHRDSVKVICDQVDRYEKAVREEAIRLEKARLKEQEAEQLRKEAEELKPK